MQNANMRRTILLSRIVIVLCACNANKEPRKMSADPQTQDAARIDTTGWTPSGTGRWRNPRGGELQVVTSSAASSEPAKLDEFRERMRGEILSRGGGLVSADLSADGVGAIIAKFPQQPSGMTYEGILVFARARTEYRVTVRFPETGITGMRDTIIFDSHLSEASDEDDPLEGWMKDPYDRTRHDPLMRNGADDDQYDSKFPDHPLTLVRAELRRLQRAL